jgi:hypothetical protein
MFLFPRKQKTNSIGAVLGDGAFAFTIVGVSHYQNDISSIVRGKTEKGHKHYCAALLSPEPTNPDERKAIIVTIRNRTVGYLSRSHCDEFRNALQESGYPAAACEALICGGWRRSGYDEGDFDVKLNAILPFKIVGPSEYWAHKQF